MRCHSPVPGIFLGRHLPRLPKGSKTFAVPLEAFHGFTHGIHILDEDAGAPPGQLGSGSDVSANERDTRGHGLQ